MAGLVVLNVKTLFCLVTYTWTRHQTLNQIISNLIGAMSNLICVLFDLICDKFKLKET